jgi:hypothetical protein
MEETICINKAVFTDIIEELQLMKESLELMNDPEFVKGMKESEKQIKNRDFGSWDDI